MSRRRFDVFGRVVEVVREEGRWVVYHAPVEGKSRPVRGAVIPDFVDEAGLARYLADLFHEGASPERPDVVELSND